MKHNWNFFQNESADAEKKALLPVLVIPLVVIVLMIVIVLADYSAAKSAGYWDRTVVQTRVRG